MPRERADFGPPLVLNPPMGFEGWPDFDQSRVGFDSMWGGCDESWAVFDPVWPGNEQPLAVATKVGQHANTLVQNRPSVCA